MKTDTKPAFASVVALVLAATLALFAAGPRRAAADQVIPDDLIVQGSECVGLDCVNNESFGFSTIRLKENNLRIEFDDTSVSAGFPANDWQITVNDSSSGGASKFSIEDLTGAKVPFTLTAGATTDSIFVDSTGRVGFRTKTPVLDLHVNTGNTPAFRMQQNASGGFSAQTWDVAGNEANFFVRDVTGGSRLPFRIRPGAPTSSIDIGAIGDVGMGTASPQTPLHILRNIGAPGTRRDMLRLENNGGVSSKLVNTATGVTWIVTGANSNNSYTIRDLSGPTVDLELTTAGNLIIGGTLTQLSDRESKRDIEDVDPAEILARVVNLSIATWRYKEDPTSLHFGPMAQDFAKRFGLGKDDKHIAPGDMAGVALAAIQGLRKMVAEKDQEIAVLRKRIDDLATLRAKSAALEARISALESTVPKFAAATVREP